MDTDTQPTRSAFVTALAWVFIVLGGFATLIGLLQNAMIFLVFPRDEMQRALAEQSGAEQMPAFATFLFGHFELFFLGFLLLSLFTLVSAIGLLKRRNWARIAFITILSFGIAWNLVGLGFQLLMFDAFPPVGDVTAQEEFRLMMTVMRVFSVIFALGFAVLFGWLIRRLVSTEIRAEFPSPRH